MPIKRAITDPQLPPTIARDAEFQAADAAHVAQLNPHDQYLLKTGKAADAERLDGIDSSQIVFGENWHKASGANINIESVFSQASGFIDCYGGGGTFPPNVAHLIGFQARHGNPGAPTTLWGMQAGCRHDLNSEFYFRTISGNVFQPWRRIWNDGNFNPATIFHGGWAPTIKAPLPSAAIAANSLALSWNSVQPGLGIAEFCNFSGNGGGPAAFDFFRLPGAQDATPTLSNRIASISVFGAYSQTSDARVKTDIQPAPGLEILMKLEPVKYRHWNCIGFDKGKKKLRLGETFIEKIGFLAQQVRQVIPEAVSQPQTDEELYALDYNCLVPVAIAAIQEQQEQIKLLRQQVQELQARL